MPALMVIFAFILSAAYIQTKIIQWSDGDVKKIRFLRTILMTYFEVILIVWIILCYLNMDSFLNRISRELYICGVLVVCVVLSRAITETFSRESVREMNIHLAMHPPDQEEENLSKANRKKRKKRKKKTEKQETPKMTESPESCRYCINYYKDHPTKQDNFDIKRYCFHRITGYVFLGLLLINAMFDREMMAGILCIVFSFVLRGLISGKLKRDGTKEQDQ